MKKVTKEKANICPYCHKTMEEHEGLSEILKSGQCNINCHYCEKTYYYIENTFNLLIGEIKQLEHALIDAKAQVEYLYGNLTPTKQSITKHTTKKCIVFVDNGIELIRNKKGGK